MGTRTSTWFKPNHAWRLSDDLWPLARRSTMMLAAHQGEFSVLVVWALDRIIRGTGAEDSAMRDYITGNDGGRASLCRIAGREGIDAALNAARYYGIPVEPFLREHEDRERAVIRQATVHYNAPVGKRTPEVPQRRPASEYLEHGSVLELFAVRRLPWSHPLIQAEIARIDEESPYVPEGAQPVQKQRSAVTVRRDAMFNADLPKPAPRPVSAPPNASLS